MKLNRFARQAECPYVFPRRSLDYVHSRSIPDRVKCTVTVRPVRPKVVEKLGYVMGIVRERA
jgi:hypothetical protein